MADLNKPVTRWPSSIAQDDDNLRTLSLSFIWMLRDVSPWKRTSYAVLATVWSWWMNPIYRIKPNYFLRIFTHLKLCLADAIHNFRWVKIIQIWQMGGKRFWHLFYWCHVLSLPCSKSSVQKMKKHRDRRLKGSNKNVGLMLGHRCRCDQT